MILAFMCVSMYASQVVTGVTLNLFCLSLTTYIYGALFGVSMELPRVVPMRAVTIPFLKDIPLLGPIFFEHKLFVYMTLVLAVAAAFFLYRTTVGLKIRAVGEKPSAAETTGIKVYMTRYMCVILAGVLAGIGGAILSVGEVGSFSRNMSSGRGFMALAIVIFGGWNPLKAIAASLVFGAATSLQMSLQAFDLPIPSQFLLSFPYIITVVAMAIAAYRSSAPSSLATPYIKE